MTLIDILIFAVLSIGTVFLYFWLFRQYRIDAFRQRAFAVRDDLFDFAVAGNISFDHPAYLALRNLVNGYIRFSHRISLLHVAMMICLTKTLNREYQIKSFEIEWQESLRTLSPEIQEGLMVFRMRAEMNLFYFLFLSSFLKKIAAIPMIGAAFISFSVHRGFKKFKEFWLYAYKNNAERYSVKQSIGFVNEDAYYEGRLQTA